MGVLYVFVSARACAGGGGCYSAHSLTPALSWSSSLGPRLSVGRGLVDNTLRTRSYWAPCTLPA